MPDGFIPQGDEFQVNTETVGSQYRPSVTALADGGFVVTWESGGQDGSDDGIYGQRYDSDGATVGDEFQVNTETANAQWNPTITALADGGFVVAWTSSGQDGSGYGIYGQRFGADGATVGGEFQVNTETTDDQYQPSITALADGGFVVTWQSSNQDGSGNGVYGQRYGAEGATVGDEFRVNTETTNDQRFPSITALADGGFVVTWESDGQDGDDYGVYGQRYGANGATVGDEFQVNTETTNHQIYSAVAALADGGFVVTWSSDDQDGSGFGVYGQRYDASGTTVGDEFQVNTETADNQISPSITALADGGFIVTWGSFFQDGSFTGIYGQRYGVDGTTIGDEFQINTETTESQHSPSITALTDGGFVVTWISPDSSGNGIFAQQFATQTFGTSADETMLGTAGSDWLDGRGGSDILKGKKGADTLYGESGRDTLKGGKGADMLHGGNGKDVLKGGKGKDILEGGAGKDELFGGKGADVFVFSPDEGVNIIRDFKDGVDKIDLSGFGFALKHAALLHFYEIGSAKNNVTGFEFEGTAIKIHGLDLGDINGADIII